MSAEGNNEDEVDDNTILARSGHIAVAAENYMLVWGGYQENDYLGDRYLPSEEVNIYNIELKQWITSKTSGKVPPGTSGAAGYLVNDNLYVFAGHTDEGNTNDLYKLDLKKMRWSTYESLEDCECPSPRDKFAYWSHENRLYCFGGFGLPLRGFLSTNGHFVPENENQFPYIRGWNDQLFYFDTTTEKWYNPKCQGKVPLARAAHTAVRFDTRVFIFGGRHMSRRMNDLHCLDLDTVSWSGELFVEGTVPCGRSWNTFTKISDCKAFLYGGYSSTQEPLGDAWLLDVDTLQWCQVILPSHRPRLWHSACCSRDGEVIVFGGCCNDILKVTEPTVHTNKVLIFKTKPYSLVRICLETAFKYRQVTEDDWGMLPTPLRKWLVKKMEVTESQQRHASLRPRHRQLHGSTCTIS